MEMGKLNELMEMDHVIHVAADGTVTGPQGVYAPDLYVMVDTEDQFVDGAMRDLITGANHQGWDLVSYGVVAFGRNDGFAAPDGDAVQHSSTRIGGACWDLMREHPGFWVVLSPKVLVSGCQENYPGHGELCDDCRRIEERGLDGWVLAHKED